MVVKHDALPVEAASEFLKNFTNPTRLRLLCALAHGESSVGELAEAAGAPLAQASQQLAHLRHDRLVVARRHGQTVTYRLANENVSRFIEVLASSFCPKTQGVPDDPDPAAEKRI